MESYTESSLAFNKSVFDDTDNFIDLHLRMDVGILLLFYALYYGVMARDLAEICAEKMASGIGYYTPTGIPSREDSIGVACVLIYEACILRNTRKCIGRV